MTRSHHNFSAAIFDFDETIIDLEAQHTRASLDLCAALGSDYMSMPEDFRKGSGRRVIDDVREQRAFFGWTQPLDELFALRQRFFARAVEEGRLELMPGAERAIRALHDAGLTLAITSSAVRDSIESILRRFGLRERFALIVDGSEVHRGKPDPEAYLLTLAKLNGGQAILPVRTGEIACPPLVAAQCVVFEDSTVGVTAAKAAGMFCVAVRNPRAQMRQDLEAADIELESFEELDLEALTSTRSERSTQRRA